MSVPVRGQSIVFTSFLIEPNEVENEHLETKSDIGSLPDAACISMPTRLSLLGEQRNIRRE